MQTSFPAVLQIISLNLSDTSDDDFMCSISLMKGMQNFGQIKFKIDKQQTQYSFPFQKIIRFFYAPRLTTRRDVFFKIILTDLQSMQQMGQIPISTHMLAQKFQENPSIVIENTSQFFEGVSLKYKIFSPITKQDESQNTTIGFRNAENDNFISHLFSQPVVHPERQTMKTSLLMNTSANRIPTAISIQDQIAQPISSVKSPQTSMFESIKNINPVSFFVKRTQTLKTQQIPVVATGTTGGGELLTSQFINQLLQISKQSTFNQKRHTLKAANHGSHHGSHKLSIKLKIVIFMLIFGFIFTLFDVMMDKYEKKSTSKSIKKVKKAINKKAKSQDL